MTASEGIDDINREANSLSHQMLSRHCTDNMASLVLADSQGKYFDNILEEHHILTLFNSGDKIEDLLPKYRDVIPSFKFIIIQIGSNNSQDDEVTILTKMKQLFEEICRINSKAQVLTSNVNLYF